MGINASAVLTTGANNEHQHFDSSCLQTVHSLPGFLVYLNNEFSRIPVANILHTGGYFAGHRMRHITHNATADSPLDVGVRYQLMLKGYDQIGQRCMRL